MVNQDRVQGTIKEVAGRAKHQLGECTGNTNKQMEGLAQEVKGKAQKTWGAVKDAARDARKEVKRRPAGRNMGNA